MRLLTIQAIKLSAFFCLSVLIVTAAPLSRRRPITLDLPESAAPPRIIHGIDICDRIRWHREPGSNEHGPGRFDESDCADSAPVPAAAPEPGYEWLLGFLLVGIGCASRLRRK